jgi:hypothetical protein
VQNIPGLQLIHNSRGFSLLEVLFGVTVFMIGMLGVTALNISSLKSGAFSGNMSEATNLAASKIEELMILDYDDVDNMNDADADGTDQDPTEVGSDTVGGGNFGLDDCPGCNTADLVADHTDSNVGRNDMYTVYWNIAVDEPIADNKTINVIVEWSIKDVARRMNIETIRMDAN